MTSLPHSFWFNYLTDFDSGVTRSILDWDASKIVKGLKKEPFKGYVRWRVGGKWVDYTSANIEDFVNVFMPAMGSKLAGDIDCNFCIVPIPNSGMSVGAKGRFRVLDLAQKFIGRIADRAVVTPAIRWDKPREKAHKTKGWRSPEMFQPHMRLAEAPKRPVVIFDDILTSGSQSIAATRFLREKGFDVVHIVSIAKAGKTQAEKPFGWRTEELEIDHEGIDFEDF